jgi:hypothetical protein
MTYTIAGGKTTFTKGMMDTLTISGAIPGLAGLSSASNLLSVWWAPSTADDKAGSTSPHMTYLYANAAYTFNPTLLSDLSAYNPTVFGSPGFITDGCTTTCSPAGTAMTSASGTYQIASETLSFATSTPEPASFLLIGAGLIAASILRKKKSARGDSDKG